MPALRVQIPQVHDVAHPGYNNLFEIKTYSPLAVRYNDASVLENMHASCAFEITLGDESCNWFELLAGHDAPVNIQEYARRMIIAMVLATDMTKHTKQVEDLKHLAADLKVVEEEDDDEAPESEDGVGGAVLNGVGAVLNGVRNSLHPILNAAEVLGTRPAFCSIF